ncbi:MAG: efflux RND transporter periplasmic adaptor subunit [Candidatus Deferrimicrobiaceae bacterium]
MTRRGKYGAGAALIAAAAAAYFLHFRSETPVDVFGARKEPIEEIVTAVSAGTVKSRRDATISAEVSGRVVEVRVAEGDSVRKGEMLARLSDPELGRQAEAALAEVTQAEELLAQAAARREEAERKARSDVARAASNLRKAEQDHERARELFRGGFLSKAEMEQADTRLANAREDERIAAIGEVTLRAIDREIESLRARVTATRASSAALAERTAKFRIAAPFPGIVTKKILEVGETKQPGAPLFVVADTRDIYIEAPIDESESAKVREGQKVRLYPDAYLGETFAGVVSEVKPTIEVSKEVSRANTIEIQPASPPRPLRLGMSVDVEVLTGRKEDALQVPSSAVMEREGKKFVYIVREGKIVRSDIATGISNWDRTEVLSGVSPGDDVVTSLEIKDLGPGSRVGIQTRH